MIQSEYSRKHNIPQHIVQRASYGLPPGRYFEEKQMDEAMIRLLNGRIKELQEKIKILSSYVDEIVGEK